MVAKSATFEDLYSVPSFIEFLDSISELEPSDFAENKELIGKYSEELEELYKRFLKHFYSDISIYCSGKEDDDIEYVVENLTILNRENRKNRDLRINIAKIVDHIRLVQYREMEFNEKIESAISSSVNSYYKSISDAINYNLAKAMEGTEDALKKISDTDSKLVKIDDNIGEIDGRLRSVNIDIIAVLSIFSAVIISFFGGLNFIGQALASMNNGNPKLTIIVITVSGIVVFNIIYFLFWVIGKTIRVPISFECKEQNCNKCDDNCGVLKSLWKRHPVFVIVNILLAITIGITYLKLPGMFVDKVNFK